MCFKINLHAVRPDNTTVYKVFIEKDGKLYSPHLYLRILDHSVYGSWARVLGTVRSLNVAEWVLGQQRELPAGVETSTSGDDYLVGANVRKSTGGFYVWLSKDAAITDARFFTDRYVGDNKPDYQFVVVECEVSPGNWLFTAKPTDYENAATYRTLKPVRIIGRSCGYRDYTEIPS